MCGIVGISSPSDPVDRALLQSMRDTMRHRGPDSAGIWVSQDGQVGLGHRRLAIIDTTESGHQPMLDESGKLCIIYNGEIYNFHQVRHELEGRGHRFRTSSDTEVILEAYRAWGTDCLLHFNGVYAFCLYDSDARRLFIARDRPGEKPLFYWQDSGLLIFASELKAIMAHPSFERILDLEALDFFLAYGYVPGERCMLKGVRKLPQGHAMTFDLETRTLDKWQYWRLPEHSGPGDASEEELLEELDALLEDSVRLRLTADVPVGILLSGGVDSSLVTAMAARSASGTLNTFTVSFPGHGAFDEGPYARLVADFFGTNHTELVAEGASFELLPDLARQYDEPMADASMVPTFMVSRMVSQQAKVALGGDGGDELFGGYPHYNWIQRLERVHRVVPGALRRLLRTAARDWLPPGSRGRNHLIGAGGDLASSVAHINLFFDGRTRQDLLVPGEFRSRPGYVKPEEFRAGLCNRDLSALQQSSRADFQTTMVDAYLVKADRASMLNGLEIRAPMLDHRIIELAYGRLPDSLRASQVKRKILLRRLAERLLPESLDLERKQGFSMPLATWLRGEWGDYFESILVEADPTLFRQEVIRGLLSGQRRGRANADRLFALTLFELWRRQYRVGFAS